MSKRKLPFRALKIGDKILEISKATAIHSESAEMVALDKLKDGTWRLIYNSKTIEDPSQIQTVEIIRE